MLCECEMKERGNPCAGGYSGGGGGNPIGIGGGNAGGGGGTGAPAGITVITPAALAPATQVYGFVTVTYIDIGC